MVAWESLLERDAIVLFELSPGVIAYEEQPSIELYYEGSVPRKYYPDFALTLRNGSVAHVEVKPKKKLSNHLVYARLHQIAANYQRQARQFWILTDEEIRKQPRLSNLTQCAYYLKAGRSEKPPLWELHELQCRDDWTFETLAAALGGAPSVFRLLASGLAFCKQKDRRRAAKIQGTSSSKATGLQAPSQDSKYDKSKATRHEST